VGSYEDQNIRTARLDAPCQFLHSGVSGGYFCLLRPAHGGNYNGRVRVNARMGNSFHFAFLPANLVTYSYSVSGNHFPYFYLTGFFAAMKQFFSFLPAGP
jgi:hypothetical protein